MFPGLPLDRRTHAVVVLRMLAEHAADADVPLKALGEIAQEIATILLEDADTDPQQAARRPFRVIDGGLR